MRRFVAGLSASDIEIVEPDKAGLSRIVELLDRYADNQLDYTDAAIISIAERLAITRIATYDRRDFSVVRPRHCTYFEPLPDG